MSSNALARTAILKGKEGQNNIDMPTKWFPVSERDEVTPQPTARSQVNSGTNTPRIEDDESSFNNSNLIG